MEMRILLAVQNMRCAFLDSVFVAVFNDFVGSKGQMWVWLGLLLFIIPKTRKCGGCVLISYLLAYFFGDGVLKELIARPRPCAVDQSVALLVSRPTSFSCPSVHSYLAFASAVPVYKYFKKAGTAAIVFAALVGFSRMYFFVHYPSDVLFGAVLGILTGLFVVRLVGGSGKER